MNSSSDRTGSWWESLAVRSALVLAMLFGLLFAVGLGVLWYLNQPLWIALLFGFTVVFGQYLVAPWLLDRLLRIDWQGKREFGPEFDQWLKESCTHLKIHPPRMGVIHDGNPNAFTYGRTRYDARVVVTSGLLEILSEAEIRAVVAHELEHIAHNDFIVMTVAQSVPLALYIIYTWTRDRARDGAWALAVSLGAYAAYIASQFVVLSLSRVREFFADEGAGKLTNDPNALATALVKIAYGMAPHSEQVAYEEALKDYNKKEKGVKKTAPIKPRNLGGAAALGICHLESAGTFAISSADASGRFSPILMQRAAQWELKNPWAKWYELNSTHPLTVRRLLALSQQALRLGQIPEAMVEADERTYRGHFWWEFALSALPYLLGVVGYFVGFMLLGLQGAQSWSPALAGYGLGLGFKTWYAYPRLESATKRQVASLIGEEIEASGISSVPCEIEGEVIGRGVPGLFWSKDLILRDESGFITLQYRQPFWFLELCFAILRAQRFVGQQVKVRGWYRRAPVPYIEVEHLSNPLTAESLRCFFLQGTLFWSVFFLIVGGCATYTQTDIATAFWNLMVWIFQLFAHR